MIVPAPTQPTKEGALIIAALEATQEQLAAPGTARAPARCKSGALAKNAPRVSPALR
jgi:hypothetical protein